MASNLALGLSSLIGRVTGISPSILLVSLLLIRICHLSIYTTLTALASNASTQLASEQNIWSLTYLLRNPSVVSQ